MGLECGLPGAAQIGKGMWAMPDLMADMLEQKIAHPQGRRQHRLGAVPTAATLHASHYHQVDVAEPFRKNVNPRARPVDDILAVPLAPRPELGPRGHPERAGQQCPGYSWLRGALGRQGVGCSKVPDINKSA